MALSIKHPEAGRLARRLSALTGESLTEAVINALKERLARHQKRPAAPRVSEELERIAEQIKRLPLLDARTDDEILGYDERGLPR